MTVEVHVEGQITVGRMPEFADAIEEYKTYAGAHGYAVPDVLLGLSGEMNTIRLVFRFEDANAYEAQEVRTMRDRDYGKVAGRLGFRDHPITYSIYRSI